MDYILGPAICHDCHAPGMFWFGERTIPGGWLQRIVLGVTLGIVQYAFVEHDCTAREAAYVPEVKPELR